MTDRGERTDSVELAFHFDREFYTCRRPYHRSQRFIWRWIYLRETEPGSRSRTRARYHSRTALFLIRTRRRRDVRVRSKLESSSSRRLLLYGHIIRGADRSLRALPFYRAPRKLHRSFEKASASLRAVSPFRHGRPEEPAFEVKQRASHAPFYKCKNIYAAITGITTALSFPFSCLRCHRFPGSLPMRY